MVAIACHCFMLIKPDGNVELNDRKIVLLWVNPQVVITNMLSIMPGQNHPMRGALATQSSHPDYTPE